jgi:hypothetical protein
VKSVRRKLQISGGVLLAASLVVSVAAGGCQLIAGLTGNYMIEPSSDAGPGKDAGGGGGDDAGNNTGCESAQPPAPPPETAGGGTISFVVAVRTVDLGDLGDTPGYDLDHICTCTDDAGPSCLSPTSHCDVPGTGIDNSAAGLIQLVESTSSNVNFHSTNLDTTANEGKWTLLIQVSDYNGEPDDFDVNVALYPSSGLGSTPSWDGSDMWPVEPSSVGEGGVSDPVYTSLGAYVSGGVLVAGLPNVGIVFSGGSTFSLSLVSGILTGKLVKGAHGWSITDGIVAGRWPTQAVFEVLSTIQTGGAPICTNSPLFSVAKNAICNAADIRANASDPPTLPCDAISMGFGFAADPAQIGGLGPQSTFDGGCPPGTDPSTTMCN